MSVRARYAPSPTGSPHVGNIRTALFDFLFARRHGGQMVVRIEDTDRARLVPGVEEEILESLRWVGIEWDEGPDVGGPHGPYRQSERAALGMYDRLAADLLKAGHAYEAFDTTEELEEMRRIQQLNRQPVGYFGGEWRTASRDKIEEAKRSGRPRVLRLKMPREGKIICHDAIRGDIEFEAELVDDPVLLKADGMPTYHFAAMVDDHLMEISHVIRGEEWIASAPKHIWLFQAFGWTPPEFVHVPVINGPDGKKLSKRHGDTSCLEFRYAGYLPEALANFIALIGWSPGGDRELMSMEEMCEAFDLSGLQPSPGVFDIEKLRWMNGCKIRELSPERLVREVSNYLAHPGTADYLLRHRDADPSLGESLLLLKNSLETDPETARKALLLEQPRVTTLAEFGPKTAFFFQDEVELDEKAVAKWFGEPHVPKLFEDLIAWIRDAPDLSARACEDFLRAWAREAGFEKLGPVVHPTRVALTGTTAGPGLFELMEVLGRERMIRRLRSAMERLW